MEPYADISDVEAVWGEIPAGDVSKVEAWIAEASRKLRLIARKRGVDLDALVGRDELAREAARDAVVNAVVRVLKNPEGFRQRSRTTGPWSESGTIDSALSTGAVYISDQDLIGWLPAGRNKIKSFRLKAGLL